MDYLKNTKVRILVFMCDDIGRALDGTANDEAKIFESHSYTLNWYDAMGANTNEKEVKLRKLINKRLKVNFDNFSYRYKILKTPGSLSGKIRIRMPIRLVLLSNIFSTILSIVPGTLSTFSAM